MTEAGTITRSPAATTTFGRELAARLRAPMLLLLSGDLGAGKTTLTKGLIAGLGAAREDEVTSPTFTLVHLFRRAADNLKVYHVDLYRVSGFADLESLGLEDVLAESAIMIVEWPDRLTLRTDWPAVHVRLKHIHAQNTDDDETDDDEREIAILDPCGVLAEVSGDPVSATGTQVIAGRRSDGR